MLIRGFRLNRYVALKIVKSARHYTEAAEDEVQLCTRIAKANPQALGHNYVVGLLDSFEHFGQFGKRNLLLFVVFYLTCTCRYCYGV